MQPVSDLAARVLQSASLTVGLRAQLLDASNVVVEDITPDVVVAGSVDRDCYATIHGSCKLSVSRVLAWGSVRVLPSMVVSSTAGSVSFPLGVYILTTPDTPVGETPATFQATGYDLLYLLSQQIRDPIQFLAGADVLDSVRAVIASAGVTSPVLLDSTAAGKPLSADLSWVPSSSAVPTYLDVINALLKTISYRGLWCDWLGNFRSEPYLAPVQRPAVWTFTADDPYLSLIGADRTVSADYFPVPNWWRFVQNGLTGAPVEGAGQYTFETPVGDPTSQAALGYYKTKWQWLDAVDQESLQAQGDAIVATDRQVTTVYKGSLAPFPALWHQDVCTLVDTAAGGSYKALAHSWSLPLDGSDMTVSWDLVA